MGYGGSGLPVPPCPPKPCTLLPDPTPLLSAPLPPFPVPSAPRAAGRRQHIGPTDCGPGHGPAPCSPAPGPAHPGTADAWPHHTALTMTGICTENPVLAPRSSMRAGDLHVHKGRWSGTMGQGGGITGRGKALSPCLSQSSNPDSVSKELKKSASGGQRKGLRPRPPTPSMSTHT